MTAPTDFGSSAQPGSGPRLRASDAQREAVVHRLHEAVGTGQLSVEEGHERTTTAYAARYVDELPLLTADLPEPPPAAPGWRAVASTAGLQARLSLLGASSWAAADRRRRRLVVLTGLLVALLVGLLLVAVVTAAAMAGSGDPGGSGGFQYEHHHDWWPH